jgi:glycolate oxidase FAD binding subunit
VSETLRPETPEQLAGALAHAARAGKSITLGGAFTKNSMGGPVAPSAVTISTSALNRILQYDPRDLTISVEAGLRYSDLDSALAEHRQMLPLDPPYSDTATIGGILAANTCGPRRRLFGTARDMVIGMKFATLEGKMVQSGGMVVKNVAGLDMSKLLIGSFGTIAAVAIANFKVMPKPAATRTFLLSRDTAVEATATRDHVLRSVLQPSAIDLLSPQASNGQGWLLAMQAGGNTSVLDRYSSELGGARGIEGEEETAFWRTAREFPAADAELSVVRVSCTLAQVCQVLEALPGPAVARAGSGVCYGRFDSAGAAANWVKEAGVRAWKAVVESAPGDEKPKIEQWPNPGDDFEIMKRIKGMFDPGNLLNRGRLYGRL